MLPFELFYASLVDEFMTLAKNYGKFFSVTYESGTHRDDYTFGITLSVMYHKDHPDEKVYQIWNAKGWNLGHFSSNFDIEARTMVGEVLANEFSRMKSIHYGTIQKGERDV